MLLAGKPVRWLPILVAAGLLFVLAPREGVAGERSPGLRGIGPRVGVSLDPNQLVLGVHADLGDVLPRTTLLAPVLEVGLGDEVTLVSLGTDVLFRFRERFGVWNPYAGAEVAFLFLGADKGGDDTELGLSGVLGVQKGIGEGNRFAAEVKFRIIDAPDVKFLVHWTIGH